MARYVVDRKTWYRGREAASSRLLSLKTGQRCCIGFVGKAVGFSDEKLLDQSTAAEVVVNSERRDEILHISGVLVFTEAEKEKSTWPAWFFERRSEGLFKESEALREAYLINDNVRLDDALRESLLAAIFAEHGDELVFEG